MPALHPKIAKRSASHQKLRQYLARDIRVSRAQGVSNARIIGSLERHGLKKILKTLDSEK